MVETFRGNEFGPYIIEPTTGNDVSPFRKWFENRHTLEESRASAVYTRDNDVIEDCFRRTLGILVKRKLENNKEVIVAFTGAYPITAIYAEDQKSVLATPRIRIDQTRVPARPMEIGTTIAIPTNDVPNASGHKPKNWLFNVLIPTTVCHLFNLAGGEAGQHNLDFDVMVANIQTRLGKIQSRLEPLGWEKIAHPSLDLVQACENTTTSRRYSQIHQTDEEDEPDSEQSIFRPRNSYNLTKRSADPNFIGQKKYYYRLPATAIPNHAEHFMDCFLNKFAWGGKENREKIHLEMRFSKEMTNVMYAVMGKDLRDPQAGHVEVRRRLFEDDDVVERGVTLYEKKKLYQSRHQTTLAYA